MGGKRVVCRSMRVEQLGESHVAASQCEGGGGGTIGIAYGEQRTGPDDCKLVLIEKLRTRDLSVGSGGVEGGGT